MTIKGEWNRDLVEIQFGELPDNYKNWWSDRLMTGMTGGVEKRQLADAEERGAE